VKVACRAALAAKAATESHSRQGLVVSPAPRRSGKA
jgi:hypothetical protein